MTSTTASTDEPAADCPSGRPPTQPGATTLPAVRAAAAAPPVAARRLDLRVRRTPGGRPPAAVLVVGLLLLVGVGVRAVSAVAPGVPTLLLAIAAGVLVRALGLVPDSAAAGLRWSSTHLLRIAVALLGLRLSLAELGTVGVRELAVLATTVAVTFAGTLAAGRWLRVPADLRLLVATGFSICGAAAVAGMSSVLRPASDDDAPGARDETLDDQIALAVALVTLYGTLALVGLPVLARLLHLPDRTAGLWIGMSVHEVAQVVAAGATVSAAALTVAVVVKLARVVLLAPLVAGVGAVRRRGTVATGGRRPALVPGFVVAFGVLVLVRSAGVLPTVVLSTADALTTVALTAAMVALGTQVHLGRLLRGGGRTVALGAVATALVVGTSLVGLLLVTT